MIIWCLVRQYLKRRKNAENDKLLGRPVIARTKENVAKIHEIVRNDIRIIANMVHLNKFYMRKICAKMVTKISCRGRKMFKNAFILKSDGKKETIFVMENSKPAKNEDYKDEQIKDEGNADRFFFVDIKSVVTVECVPEGQTFN